MFAICLIHCQAISLHGLVESAQIRTPCQQEVTCPDLRASDWSEPVSVWFQSLSRPGGNRGCAVPAGCNPHRGFPHPRPAAAVHVPAAINAPWLQLLSPERWGVPLEDLHSLPMSFIAISVVVEAGPPCLCIYSQIRLQNQSSKPVSATCWCDRGGQVI